MGKVKLAKNLETGEQVRPYRSATDNELPADKTASRLPSRLYPGSRLTITITIENGNGLTNPRRSGLQERLLS